MAHISRFGEYLSEGYRAKFRMKGSEIKELHAQAAEAVSGFGKTEGRIGKLLGNEAYTVIWDGEKACEFCPKDLLLTFKAEFSGGGWTLSDKVRINFGYYTKVGTLSDGDDYLVDKIVR